MSKVVLSFKPTKSVWKTHGTGVFVLVSTKAYKYGGKMLKRIDMANQTPVIKVQGLNKLLLTFLVSKKFVKDIKTELNKYGIKVYSKK
jgi:hypothetical protein